MTTEPTKETGWQRFERYARAFGSWVLAVVKAVDEKSQGKATYTWCIVGGIACVLWLIYHPPGWLGRAVAGAGENPDGVAAAVTVGGSILGAIASLRRSVANQGNPYYGAGRYSRPAEQYTPFDGYAGTIPGDTSWPTE